MIIFQLIQLINKKVSFVDEIELCPRKAILVRSGEIQLHFVHLPKRVARCQPDILKGIFCKTQIAFSAIHPLPTNQFQWIITSQK